MEDVPQWNELPAKQAEEEEEKRRSQSLLQLIIYCWLSWIGYFIILFNIIFTCISQQNVNGTQMPTKIDETTQKRLTFEHTNIRLKQ